MGIRAGMVCVAMMLAMAGGVRAAEVTDFRANRNMTPTGMQLEQMDRTLSLTEEQKGKIKTILETTNKDLEDLRQDGMGRIKEAMAGRNPGRGQADAAEEIRKANEEYQKLSTEGQAKVNAELTAEQRVTWETYKLNRVVMGRLSQVDLTEGQKQQIKPLVDEAGKAIAEAKDAAGANAVSGKLMKKLVNEVLTEEQAGKVLTMQGSVFSMAVMRRE